MNPTERPRCFQTGKIAYVSKTEAFNVIVKLRTKRRRQAMADEAQRAGGESNAFKCPFCKQFHIGRRGTNFWELYT